MYICHLNPRARILNFIQNATAICLWGWWLLNPSEYLLADLTPGGIWWPPVESEQFTLLHLRHVKNLKKIPSQFFFFKCKPFSQDEPHQHDVIIFVTSTACYHLSKWAELKRGCVAQNMLPWDIAAWFECQFFELWCENVRWVGGQVGGICWRENKEYEWTLFSFSV